jgi:ketosteroid isomerase-like protein
LTPPAGANSVASLLCRAPHDGSGKAGRITELNDLDDVIERHHAALGEMLSGNAEGFKALYSHAEDVTLANPFGPPARGWERVTETLERAASNYAAGEVLSVETMAKGVTPDLAYTLEMERFAARLVGMDEARPVTLRCTTVFRPEGGIWRIVHRHADPIASARPPESVLES